MNAGLEQFSGRLREARIAKQLSQRDLSKLAGVPQAHSASAHTRLSDAKPAYSLDEDDE